MTASVPVSGSSDSTPTRRSRPSTLTDDRVLFARPRVVVPRVRHRFSVRVRLLRTHYAGSHQFLEEPRIIFLAAV